MCVHCNVCRMHPYELVGVRIYCICMCVELLACVSGLRESESVGWKLSIVYSCG